MSQTTHIINQDGEVVIVLLNANSPFAGIEDPSSSLPEHGSDTQSSGSESTKVTDDPNPPIFSAEKKKEIWRAKYFARLIGLRCSFSLRQCSRVPGSGLAHSVHPGLRLQAYDACVPGFRSNVDRRVEGERAIFTERLCRNHGRRLGPRILFAHPSDNS